MAKRNEVTKESRKKRKKQLEVWGGISGAVMLLLLFGIILGMSPILFSIILVLAVIVHACASADYGIEGFRGENLVGLQVNNS